MEKTGNKRIFENYIKVIFTIYSIVFIFRLFEALLIFYNYGFSKDVLFSELIGLGVDLAGASLVIVLYFIFYFFLSKVNLLLIKVLNFSFLILSTLVSFIIIKYFLYQLIPLDIFLYNYSFQEILFTIKTSNTNLFETLLGLAFIIAILVFIAWKLTKLVFSPVIIKVTYSLVVISMPLFFLIHSVMQNNFDKFSMNKPLYFIGKTIKYLTTSTEYQNTSADEFQRLYPDKKFISEEYPLVYEKKRKNELGKYFNDFKSSPNIVIIIVEGLNDDFIYEYKGAVLMPFLNKLKDSSLYWNRCFTLGERSFAAVPSILGGLPYGDKGFTLQERLPRHLTLVSMLRSNNFFTSFYYGQAAWFHQKERFFKYNNADLIFDNSKFSSNYEKIIVGQDNFFWGYNDKDLFNQSLTVIDTLNQNKRLDIYFTGTSHSPFVISDESIYNKKLQEWTKPPYEEFYSTYAKYLKTIMFTDDALKDFFNEYKKRKEYENTIFILTGDHPITEIPIQNSLKRYHVPLIIFSEKLKKHKTFSNTVSHLDVSETILSFLQDYEAHIPSFSTSLGYELLPQGNEPTKNLAFMNDNREVVDFLSGDYFLSEGNLYEVDSELNTTSVENDSIKSILNEKLSAFRNKSLYVSRNNKIVSNDLYCKALNVKMISEYQNVDTLETSEEYFNFLNNIAVPNKDLILDIGLNVKSNENKDITFVYQISNSKDSTLLWENSDVNIGGITQAHIRIKQIPVADSIVYFKSYIWNKNKRDLIISDVDILLHTSRF